MVRSTARDSQVERRERERESDPIKCYLVLRFSSLKTEENLFAITTIPSDRLMIETDCPWCEIRPTHASANDVITHFPSVKKEKWQADQMVKGRNEPCTIV